MHICMIYRLPCWNWNDKDFVTSEVEEGQSVIVSTLTNKMIIFTRP